MRSLVLVMAALATSACCPEAWLFPSECCIQEDLGRCFSLVVDACNTSWEQGVPPPTVQHCYATHRNGTCADAGFTVQCGGYSVRPGDAC
jgi:hypothetical protein